MRNATCVRGDTNVKGSDSGDPTVKAWFSYMSPMIGESLSVTIKGENSQRTLPMSNHKQWSSPMSATYENQALFHILRFGNEALDHIGRK